MICLTLACFWAPLSGFAQASGEALVNEGNRLFRAGLYHAALGRYRDAQAAGQQGPLLDYNMGVAHYKLRHFKEAEAALRQAAREPRLAAVASYNLGLTSRAARDLDAAEHWFQLAQDRAGSPKIKRLAKKALANLRQPVVQQIPIYDRDRQRSDLELFFQRQDPIGKFSLLALARIGEDDNVYRTPSTPYVDLSQAGQPMIDPVVQSGTFMPIELEASYRLYGDEKNDFIFGYTLDGDFYLDSELNNANEIHQELSFGADVTFDAEAERSRSLLSQFIFGHHIERNFDPDNGLEREVDGVDVSDRFSYQSWGPVAKYKHKLGKYGYGFKLATEMRAYEETELVPSHNHNFFLLGGHLSYRVRPRIDLRFAYDAYLRDYRERPARDANGDRLSTNPTLKYRYQALQGTLRFRLNRRVWLRADYRRTQRDDQFVGYNDYTQNAYRVQLDVLPHRRFRANVSLTQRSFDYANAFAFNEPIGGPKDLDAMSGSVWAEFRFTKRLSAWAEVKLTDVTSTDTRTQYERTRSMLGAKWEM